MAIRSPQLGERRLRRIGVLRPPACVSGRPSHSIAKEGLLAAYATPLDVQKMCINFREAAVIGTPICTEGKDANPTRATRFGGLPSRTGMQIYLPVYIAGILIECCRPLCTGSGSITTGTAKKVLSQHVREN